MGGSVDCLGRIPYASVIAFIMVLCGAGIMCGTLYEAANITEKIFSTNFYPVDELFLVKVASIVVAACVVAFAIILLVFGVLTTGATRSRIYRGDKCIMGGRVSAGLFLSLTYVVNIFWLALSAVLVIPVIMWLMLAKVCNEELGYYRGLNKDQDEDPFKYNFNITSYGIYKKVYLYPKRLNYRENINNVSRFTFFCTEISNVGPLYACAFGGAVFVILGLVTFISALSANYMRLKYTKELTDYRASNDQATELDYMPYHKSGFGFASFHCCYSASLAACYVKLKLIREVCKYRKLNSLMSAFREEEDMRQYVHPSMEPSTLPVAVHRLPSPSAVPVFPQGALKDRCREKNY